MTEPRFSEPREFTEACRLLLASEDKAAALAGGTWIMRSGLRQEIFPEHIVSLGRIPELHSVRREEDGGLWIGAMVTHTQLAHATAQIRAFGNLHTAAAKSANPNIRNVATVGGNICATEFAAADLVPALLSLDAEVFYTDQTGAQQQPLAALLEESPGLRVVRGVRIPQAYGVGVHTRLPLRAAGDYPVAIVSGVLELGEGVITKAAISVGAVEERPRRWAELESELHGQPLDPQRAENLARELLSGLKARSSIGTPAQYRLAVIPSLVRKFISAALTETAQPTEALTS